MTNQVRPFSHQRETVVGCFDPTVCQELRNSFSSQEGQDQTDVVQNDQPRSQALSTPREVKEREPGIEIA